MDSRGKRIGMCCACGDYVSKSVSILCGGFEYCPNCAEMMDMENDEEDEENGTN